MEDKEKMTPEEALDEMVRISEELGLYDGYVSMPPEEGITPDSWVIIEVNHEGEQFQKILSGWSGGYLHGDSWRLSSPIKELDISTVRDYFIAKTGSGSIYNLRSESQGLRMSNAGMWNQLKEKFGDAVEIVKL
jgi:hypothetical protein